MQRGTAYGIREGRVMLDRRDRNPYTGAEFPVPAIVNPRMAAFTLPALSNAEARNQHRDMLRRLGAARDTLWIAELIRRRVQRVRRCRSFVQVIAREPQGTALTSETRDCVPRRNGAPIQTTSPHGA